MLAILASLFRLSRASPDDLSETLFREQYPKIVGFFRRRGCSLAESQDLAQDVFVKAHKSRASFRGEAKSSTWLVSIATNLWLNRQRARHTQKRAGQEVSYEEAGASLPQASDSPVGGVLEREQRQVLRQAIDELTPAMRRCVLLRVYQDRSYREIGNILGISEGTAKSQVSRARSLLKERLSDRFPELTSGLEEN